MTRSSQASLPYTIDIANIEGVFFKYCILLSLNNHNARSQDSRLVETNAFKSQGHGNVPRILEHLELGKDPPSSCRSRTELLDFWPS